MALKDYTLQDMAALAHRFGAIAPLFVIILMLEVMAGGLPFMTSPGADVDPWTEYGTSKTIITYLLKFTTLISVPIALANFLGFVMFTNSAPKLKQSLLFTPYVCFRVVTRGMFPELVRSRIAENLLVCHEVGVQNFEFEVVTDNAIGFEQRRVKEIVVPRDYVTNNWTLFKARALNYCWEPEVSSVSDSHWIVHLDEETMMTRSSIIGIMNFISDGKYDFGQGVITYGKGKIVNWFTSLADSGRTGLDFGILRFCLGYLHKPLFSWKGSFIVARAMAEQTVGFDFGPKGSIAEDCYFALKAWEYGFQFDFIEGEMQEISTFTFRDAISQRKRWMHGMYLAFVSRGIQWRYKIGVLLILLSWMTLPFQITSIYFSQVYPAPLYKIVHFVIAFTGGVMIFVYAYGADRSFYRRERPFSLRILIDAIAVGALTVSVAIEMIAIILQMLSGQTQMKFDIVQKENGRVELTNI